MNKQEIRQSILNNVQNSKFKNDIKSISLFGSYAFNNATDDSDVDILIDFHPQATVGFLKLAQIKRSLEKSTGKKIDLVTPDALSPYFKQSVLNNAEQIYDQ